MTKQKKKTAAQPILPQYLTQKPSQDNSVHPPAQTREQILPFGELSWENFERLCKALVEVDAEIRNCTSYGRQGAKQHGIDLFAFPRDLSDTQPRVYQCKRVKKFTASDIKGAVKKFTDSLSTLKKKWKRLPSQFVLCCRASLRSTNCQDEIVRQRGILAGKNITFTVWDEDELSRLLKDYPKIVLEFFGKNWVKVFNGTESFRAITQSVELSSERVEGLTEGLVKLAIAKDLEITNLTNALEQELSERCTEIKETYKQGSQQKALRELQSYLDRFDSDLHYLSPGVRAKFWYTAGTLYWNLPKTRVRAQTCLDKARQINPTLDVRDLQARVLVEGNKFDEALRTLEPLNTVQVRTFKLALLLDMQKFEEFDCVWQNTNLEHNAMDYEFLAYRQRLERNFEKSQQAVKMSMEKAPGIPSHLLAAGHITFWQAVPELLDRVPRSIFPQGLHPTFFAPTASQALLLEKAADYYTRAISIIKQADPQEEEQVQNIEEWLLLCLAYHPLRQAQAQELACRLLRKDPTIFFALFYCLEWDVPFEVTRSIVALEKRRNQESATTNSLYSLIKLYQRDKKPEKAIDLLKADKNLFVSEREQGVWTELMVELLVKTGQTDKLDELQMERQLDTLSFKRLCALQHEAHGRPEELEQVLLELWEATASLIDLVNLCGFYRKTEQWSKLLPFVTKLVELSPDARSQFLLIETKYQTQHYEECLAVIDHQESIFLAPSITDQIRRIQCNCLVKLNRLDVAVSQLENLQREQPGAGIAQQLAHIYFHLGRRDRAIDVLRTAVIQPGADAQLLIGTSQLLVSERPEEAFHLAQRAREEAVENPDAWVHFIQTGFLTGHDQEASEALHSFGEQFPGSAALQSVSFHEAIERIKSLQQAQRDRWDLFRRAEVPVHVLMDMDRHPLGLDWYVRFETNFKVTTWNKKMPIFSRSGSRESTTEILPPDTTEIAIDYTSLLLAHQLELLPLVERAFDRILLAPSTLALIQTESLKTAQFQLSQKKVCQEIKYAVDERKIRILRETPSDEVLEQFQLSQLGRNDALLFYLAQREGAFVLVQHLSGELDASFHLQDSLARRRVFPVEVLQAMVAVGALAEHEQNAAAVACQSQPKREDLIKDLRGKPALVIDESTAKFFAHNGLLNHLAQVFRVSMPSGEVNRVTFTLQEYRLRQECADWLGNLNRHISNQLNARYYFPSTALQMETNASNEMCTQVLTELIQTAQEASCPLWSDDRTVNRHTHVEGGNPLVTIDIVLAFLKNRNLMTSEEYFGNLLKLLELNTLFISLPPEFVSYYLRRAGIDDKGELKESYELKVIRRYIAAVFAKGTAPHNISVETGNQAETASYYATHHEVCREVLIGLWTDNSLDNKHKQTMSEWIVQWLWKGFEDIVHLDRTRVDRARVIAASQAMLVSIGFVMMFKDIKQCCQNAASYLTWLYEGYLNQYWKRNVQVREPVLQNIRQAITAMVEGKSGTDRRIFLSLMAQVWAKTTQEMTIQVLSDKAMETLFEGLLQQSIPIEDGVNVPLNTWKEWADQAIASGTGRPVEVKLDDRPMKVKWNEPSLFTAGLAINRSASAGAGKWTIHVNPFLKLCHPSSAIRAQAFESFATYLYLPQAEIENLRQRIQSDIEWTSVASRIEKDLDSSWGYFWGRHRHFVLSHIPIDIESAFPTNPEVFKNYLPLSQDMMQNPDDFSRAWGNSIRNSIDSVGLETTLSKILGLPLGGNNSIAHNLKNLINEGQLRTCDLKSLLIMLVKDTTNPLLLINCLDIFLTLSENLDSAEGTIEKILQRLLLPDQINNPPRPSTSYDLYVKALRFAWTRMDILPQYQEYPETTRFLWAYSYASSLAQMIDNLRDQDGFDIDRSELTNWLRDKTWKSKTNNLEIKPEPFSDISHPLNMTRFRLVISSTFRILANHHDRLAGVNKDKLVHCIVEKTKALSQGTEPGGWEIYKPFRSVKNFFLVPWEENVLSSLNEILKNFGPEDFDRPNANEKEILQSILTFDAGTILLNQLDQIIARKSWDYPDLVLIALALSEKVNPPLESKIAEAIQHLDLTRWSNDHDFLFACQALASCSVATQSEDIRNLALEKLRVAWRIHAREESDYTTILDAAFKIISVTGGTSEFFSWWLDALQEVQDEIPSGLHQLATSLAWSTPLEHHDVLANIRGKLGVL